MVITYDRSLTTGSSVEAAPLAHLVSRFGSSYQVAGEILCLQDLGRTHQELASRDTRSFTTLWRAGVCAALLASRCL